MTSWPKLKYALIALQVLDLATTLYVFRVGGWEANPVVSRLLAVTGPIAGVVLVKAFSILIVLRLRSPIMLGIATSIMFCVVAWNALAIAVG